MFLISGLGEALWAGNGPRNGVRGVAGSVCSSRVTCQPVDN